MKTLLISSEFPPLPGGIGNHAFLLAKFLNKNNYEVSVISDFRDEHKDRMFDQKQEFSIFRIKRTSFTYFNRIAKSYSLAKMNNIIICSGKFSLWLGGLLSLFFKRKKFVAVLHGSELNAGNSLLQKLTQWSLKRFNTLIAVSNYTKNYALKINPNLKIKVINNGIEFLVNEPLRKSSNSINLVTVGNLTQRKGQQNVIKVLPLLKTTYPDIHYHCIGITTEKEKFVNLAKSLKVSEHITFYGALSDNDKTNILIESTIFMMLSQTVKNDFEGFGIAILEANAMGIPAIGSKDSGISDAINDNYSGCLVNQEDVNDVAAAVETIMSNYSVFSENAKLWSHNFDWNRVVENYIQSIEDEA